MPWMMPLTESLSRAACASCVRLLHVLLALTLLPRWRLLHARDTAAASLAWEPVHSCNLRATSFSSGLQIGCRATCNRRQQELLSALGHVAARAARLAAVEE
ncbi:hypothetical protein GUJ93_ZPchr0009g1663 [Zizania palustris]|uniref:Uncharacterized protein n=1 Tax=Zizania palustris TaxID=103762 RepID=A0A8J5RM24_ZIZPA|nr:hypothetical protein GUJ93_ZPchr0009g1663 [Zizania palustris]